jgi:LPS export ABC transporter permease LptG
VTFGLLQKNSEITAMKATGVSIFRLTVPILVVAVAIGAALFLLDQTYLPDTNKRQEALRNEIKGRPTQTFLRQDRKWIFGESSQQLAIIYYYEFFDPDQNRFGNISVFEIDPRTTHIVRRIHADEAHWQERTQKWIFESGWTRSFRGGVVTKYETFDGATFAELTEVPIYFKKEVKQSQEMTYRELHGYIDDLQQSGFDVVRLNVQLHRKLAFPAIALVMGILAIPFSLSAGKKGTLAGVATALIIAVVYWTTSSLFEAMGNVNQLPPALAAWAPDLVFGFVGAYFVLRIPT